MQEKCRLSQRVPFTRRPAPEDEVLVAGFGRKGHSVGDTREELSRAFPEYRRVLLSRVIGLIFGAGFLESAGSVKWRFTDLVL